jgi:predicted DNA binding protein
MIKAKFHVQLPDVTWIADVSRAYPDATFRLLTGFRAGSSAIELGEVDATDPGAVTEAIEEHPSIVSFRELERTDETAIARYETTDTDLYEAVERSSVPPEYPVTVRDGWQEYEFTGSREELSRFRSGVEAAGLSYELRSVVGTDDAAGLLTDRQREVLRAAHREGYFEVPRECTLADLAASLDIDKSTASEILRRGEASVLQWFLTGAGGTLER